MRLLVFEPRLSGHRGEYLSHVIDHLGSERVDGDIETLFVVHPQFSERYPELSARLVEDPRQRLVELPEKEHEDIISAHSRMTSSLREWAAVERHAEEAGADHCLLLNVNPLQWALGLPRARQARFTVSGILFHPFVRIEAARDGALPAAGARVRRLRKFLQLRWMLGNSAVTAIHVLNDPEATERLNRKSGLRPVFSMLPDPIPDCGESGSGQEDLGEQYDVGSRRKRFLVFGSLRRNKGALQAVRAMGRLAPRVQERAALLLVGRVDTDLRSELTEAIEEVRARCGAARIVLDDRYVPDAEVPGLFARADFVLAPYQRTEGSSGVLGHAARSRTPVLGSRSGLVGDLIERYGLGGTLGAHDPAGISEAIEEAVDGKVNASARGQRTYVNERRPREFVERLLAAGIR